MARYELPKGCSSTEVAHQCQVWLSFHTHKAQEDLQLFATGQVLLQMWMLQVPARLSDEFTELCFIPSLSQKTAVSLAGNVFLLRVRKRREASRENYKELIPREFPL